MSPYGIKGLNNQACVPKRTICWLYTLFLLNQVESEAQKWKRKKVYGSWKTCKVVEFHHIILQACKFMEFASGSYRDMGNFLKLNFGEQLSKRPSWLDCFHSIWSYLILCMRKFQMLTRRSLEVMKFYDFWKNINPEPMLLFLLEVRIEAQLLDMKFN